jgi:hypothetical protein
VPHDRVVEGQPGDAELLDLIEQGKVDAEIAVRLGIPIEQARDRVQQLIRNHHAASRDELRDLLGKPAREPRQTARWNLVLLALTFCALPAGLVAGWWLRGQSEGTEPATVSFDAGPPAGSSPTAAATPATNETVLIDGRQMTPVGRLFDTAPARSSIEGHTLVLEFDLPIVSQPPQRPAFWRIAEKRPDGALFSLDNGKRQLVIIARGADGTGFAYGLNESFSIFSRTESGPTVMLTARSVLGQTYYTLIADAGWLYVSEEPAP